MRLIQIYLYPFTLRRNGFCHLDDATQQADINSFYNRHQAWLLKYLNRSETAPELAQDTSVKVMLKQIYIGYTSSLPAHDA